MLKKLRCHAHFHLSANQITWSRLLIHIQILNAKQCRSRSVGFFRSQLIWIYTVCKGRAHQGSAGLGLILQANLASGKLLIVFTKVNSDAVLFSQTIRHYIFVYSNCQVFSENKMKVYLKYLKAFTFDSNHKRDKFIYMSSFISMKSKKNISVSE